MDDRDFRKLAWGIWIIGQLMFWVGLWCYISIWHPVMTPGTISDILVNYSLGMMIPLVYAIIMLAVFDTD
jgi:hypothetical protein